MSNRISLPDYYAVEDTLARDAHTAVFRARDRRDARDVAVKTLRAPSWIAPAEAAARHRQMIGALEPLAVLRHPGLAAVHEMGVHDGVFYVARDLAGGASLRAFLDRNGPLSLYEAQRLAAQAAGALDALADVGLRHGALTAENLFVETDGTVCITDAGFAQAVGALPLPGLSCRLRRHPTCASDLAALAALVFEALTGLNPVGRRGGLLRGIGLPAPLRTVLYRALASNGRAFSSAAAFAAALQPTPRVDLFRYAWRPAAAAGLFGTLVTVGGYAFPESEAARSPIGSPAPAVVRPAPVPDAPHILPALSPEDHEAMRLAARRLGPATLAHAAVADRFELTEAQRRAIDECLAEQRERVGLIVHAAAQGAAVDTGAAMRSLREATNARILLTLDGAQRALWLEIAGSVPMADEPRL